MPATEAAADCARAASAAVASRQCTATEQPLSSISTPSRSATARCRVSTPARRAGCAAGSPPVTSPPRRISTPCRPATSKRSGLRKPSMVAIGARSPAPAPRRGGAQPRQSRRQGGRHHDAVRAGGDLDQGPVEIEEEGVGRVGQGIASPVAAGAGASSDEADTVRRRTWAPDQRPRARVRSGRDRARALAVDGVPRPARIRGLNRNRPARQSAGGGGANDIVSREHRTAAVDAPTRCRRRFQR